MPQYLTPGVYVEEVDRGARPIQGASTSVAGAVGVTVRGPTEGKPVLVTSFNEYTQTFGGYFPEPPANIRNNWNDPKNPENGYWWLFTHAVKGFFDNGGKQLFVKRVFSGGRLDPGAGKKVGRAVAAGATTGRGFISEVTKGAAKGSKQVTLRHLFGVRAVGGSMTLQIFNAKTRQPIKDTGGNNVFEVTGYDATAMTVSLKTAFDEEVSDARGDFAVVATPNPGSATLTFTAKAKGTWGNSLQVRVRPMDQKAVPTLTLLANPGLDPTPLTTGMKAYTPAAGGVAEFIEVNDAGMKAGDTVEIAGNRYTLKDLAGGADPKKFEFAPAKPGDQDWANTKPTVRKIRRVNPKGISTAVKAYTPAAAGPPPVAEFVEFNDAGLKAGDKVEIAGVQYTLKDLAAGADPKKFEFNPAAPAGGWPAATAVRKVQGGEN